LSGGVNPLEKFRETVNLRRNFQVQKYPAEQREKRRHQDRHADAQRQERPRNGAGVRIGLFRDAEQRFRDAPQAGLREPLLNPAPQQADGFDNLFRVEVPVHGDKFPSRRKVSSGE